MRLPDRELESALPREGGFAFVRFTSRRGFALKDLQSALADGSSQTLPGRLLDWGNPVR
jgi:hypothetical protein